MFQSAENEKLAYLLHAKLNAYKKRVAFAQATVKQALENSHNPLLSFSGGKDSVVMLDIAVKAGFKGMLIFFKYGIISDAETPIENIELLKYYAYQHGLNYHIIDCLGEVDCWEECGEFLLEPETREQKRIFHKTNYDFAKKSERFCREHQIDLQIIGMRKKESLRRKAMLCKKGVIYATQSRSSLTCCPLANFSNEDIWAYIFTNKLKYLSIYDYPYIDRRVNRNEITLLYNHSLIENGMFFHYKNMYPEFFTWLEKRWGNMA